ncbi:hypothetical protein Ciccas_014068, partial [Cichlidogyrus casuarinus]
MRTRVYPRSKRKQSSMKHILRSKYRRRKAQLKNAAEEQVRMLDDAASDTSNYDPPKLEIMPTFDEDETSHRDSLHSPTPEMLRPGKVLLLCPATKCQARFDCVILLVNHYRLKHCNPGRRRAVQLKIFSCPVCLLNEDTATTASSDLDL